MFLVSGVASKTKKKSKSFKGRTDELSQMRLKIANLHTCPPPARPSVCLPLRPPILLTHASLPSLPSLAPCLPLLLCFFLYSCTPASAKSCGVCEAAWLAGTDARQ